MGAVALLAGKCGFPQIPLSGVPPAKAGMGALPPIGAADPGADVAELPKSPPVISKSKGDEKDKKKRNKKKKKKVKAKDVINVYLWKRSHKGDESDRIRRGAASRLRGRRGSATGCAPPAFYNVPFGLLLPPSTTRGAALRTRLLVAEEARGAAERGFVECWGACVPPLGPSHRRRRR